MDECVCVCVCLCVFVCVCVFAGVCVCVLSSEVMSIVCVCFCRRVCVVASEVLVGAQCGSAVLRGAHVFAPGMLSAPKSKKTHTHTHTHTRLCHRACERPN